MFRTAMTALFTLALSLTTPALAGDITITGSTSVARLMEVLAEQFEQTHSETFIAVQATGSSAGITLVKRGIAELGMTSRYLTEEEKTDDIVMIPMAFDGLALVVNQNNPISNLNEKQLVDIYQGRITNWKQVGGLDEPISVVTREASSGSRYSFETLLGLTKVISERLVSDITAKALVVNSNSMVKTLVHHNRHAIGFVSIGSVDKSIKALTFEGITASTANVANKKYGLSRPFILIYQEDVSEPKVLKFVSFIQSQQGQATVNALGYTPVKL